MSLKVLWGSCVKLSQSGSLLRRIQWPRAEEHSVNGHVFITKDNHVVTMGQGCAENEQPGDGWAPLGEILPGINPLILLDRIGRSSDLQ